MFGFGEVLVIVAVLFFVFGAKKLPDIARAAGNSARILKSEEKAMKREAGDDSSAAPPRGGSSTGRLWSPVRKPLATSALGG